jgi:cell division protein FtsA
MLSRQALAAVIEPRVEELFSLVQQVVRESGYEELLSSGVVVTGGTALMDGMVELGEDIFLKPVRLGVPDYTGNLADVVRSPRFSTAMGLLQEARVQRLRGRRAASTRGGVKDIFQRMREWFVGNF